MPEDPKKQSPRALSHSSSSGVKSIHQQRMKESSLHDIIEFGVAQFMGSMNLSDSEEKHPSDNQKLAFESAIRRATCLAFAEAYICDNKTNQPRELKDKKGTPIKDSTGAAIRIDEGKEMPPVALLMNGGRAMGDGGDPKSKENQETTEKMFNFLVTGDETVDVEPVQSASKTYRTRKTQDGIQPRFGSVSHTQYRDKDGNLVEVKGHGIGSSAWVNAKAALRQTSVGIAQAIPQEHIDDKLDQLGPRDHHPSPANNSFGQTLYIHSKSSNSIMIGTESAAPSRLGGDESPYNEGKHGLDGKINDMGAGGIPKLAEIKDKLESNNISCPGIGEQRIKINTGLLEKLNTIDEIFNNDSNRSEKQRFAKNILTASVGDLSQMAIEPGMALSALNDNIEAQQQPKEWQKQKQEAMRRKELEQQKNITHQELNLLTGGMDDFIG